MQTLFIISVLCFLGILWAALALARHIKAGQFRSPVAAPTHADFKHYLLSITPAASVRSDSDRSGPSLTTPLRSALQQNEALPASPLAPATALVASEPVRETIVAARTAPQPPPMQALTVQPAPVIQRERFNGLNQSVHDIAANKQWILPPHAVRIMHLPLQRIGRPRRAEESTAPQMTARKPPQSTSRSGVLHRLDPAYFNKDLGDLTDPYQPQPRLRANDRKGPN